LLHHCHRYDKADRNGQTYRKEGNPHARPPIVECRIELAEGTLVPGGAPIAPHTSPSRTCGGTGCRPNQLGLKIPTSGANSPDPAQDGQASDRQGRSPEIRAAFSRDLGLLENEYCCENRHKRDTDDEKQPVCTFEPEQYSNLFWRTRHNS